MAAVVPAATDTPVTNEEKWGIEVLHVRLSGSGYWLDFRYRVIDPAKSSDFLKADDEITMIHQASNTKLSVPTSKFGRLRQTTANPEAKRVYFALFGNTGKVVQRGDLVTIVVGDFKAENITVE